MQGSEMRRMPLNIQELNSTTELFLVIGLVKRLSEELLYKGNKEFPRKSLLSPQRKSHKSIFPLSHPLPSIHHNFKVAV